MPFEEIKVKIKSYFDGKGFAELSRAGNAAEASLAKSTRKATMLAGVMGQMDGSLGKVANGVSKVAQGFAVLGPIGASIAGLKLVIDMVGERFIQKANAMKEAAERMGEKVRANFEKMKTKTLEEINDQLAKATTKAAEAANRFEALASAYMKVAQAKAAADKSEGGAVSSGLALEKSHKMSDAKTMEERARIGADYDVRIAEQNLSNTRGERDSAVSTARKEASDAKRRRTAARNTEREAQSAVNKATAEYERYDNAGANKDVLDELKKKMGDAQAALEKATNERIKAVADAKAADIKVKEAELNRVTAVNNALTALEDARRTERDLIQAQKDEIKAREDLAKAEREKAAREKKEAEDKAKSEAKVQLKDQYSSEVSRWQGEFNAAFDLWRDPDAASAAVEADKKRGEDMKRFRKEVNRYGGKGKIDEYARLMREGDEEGMQERLSEWRKSSKFTPQVEQMVKAAAADQNKNAAEKSLANIEKDVSGLAKKIEELLSFK